MTDAIKMLREILETDDNLLESGFEDLVKIIEIEGNFEESVTEKLSYCRANNLTVDDLLEENRMIKTEIPKEFESMSPIKKKFLDFIFSKAIKVNEAIINQGLHPTVKVRVQKLPYNEKLPAYAHESGDSGLDVFLTEDITIEPKTTIIAKTGIKVAIPLGYELQVRPRSGLSLKIQDLFVANSPGTINNETI